MLIGVPKEIKDLEYRVGMTPGMASAFVAAGHRVMVQRNAGAAIGFSDEMYGEAGCQVVESAADVYKAEMIIKVKEPLESEFPLMHEGQVIFGYFHLAPDPEQTRKLIEKGVVAIAYETVTDEEGRLPLLAPMSEIAGRISIQAGANALQIANGGKGILLGGVPGVPPAKVVVLGGGYAGKEAARMAIGLGADVTILEKDMKRLRQLDDLFGPRLKTIYSTPAAVDELIPDADLVIGAVLIPGKRAPRLVKESHVKAMAPGSVIVDVSIDQGGCFETSHPTSHSKPTYVTHGVVHYCVVNMPGACARTSTQALTNATFRYALNLANLGFRKAMLHDPHLREGLNIYMGHVTNAAVAQDLNYKYFAPIDVLNP